LIPSADHSDKFTVITTHVNADFDAVASLLAAQKLYPEARVVFPGSQEKNLRNFFVSTMVYLLNMVEIKEIDFDRVQRLVMVDTRQPQRIGRLAGLLDRRGIEIHAYDHHPDKADDVKADFEVVRITGATVTILTEILQERDISISPDEATIMCLGIYEDTGSFSFHSTTPADFHAAAYLLSCGANLNIVSNLISREISPQQVSLLNEMIQSATRYNIHGVEVVVTSVTTDDYVPDFAFLVHKLIRMESLEAVFALARMENKIYVVGRSRVPDVDAAAILEGLGGGGHSYAAAASVKGRTLAQVEHQLVDSLYKHIRSRRQAKDLMSAPAITVEAGISCKKAGEIMTRYNINALLVTRADASTPGKPVLAGFVTRQVVEKALYHKLGRVPVADYMTTEMAVVSPTSDLTEIQDKIIENKQRILPVMEEGRIMGVITRTDLLNILVRSKQPETDQISALPDGTVHARTRSVQKFMRERISDHIIEKLKAIGKIADEMGYPTYVVGGFVRDLFLYRRNEDIDVVVEGDGIAFAREFARQERARVHTHEKFGTAVIIFPDGFKIDVASARMEYYRFPAALPIVEMSSIKLDLFRRDFTINTLAIQLNPKKFGTLVDFFAAQKDIKEKTIRVLHNLSFVEDPTRVFRAIRFEQRFGFSIGKLTVGLIENAVRMDFFKRLSGKRVFSELKLILEEENPTPAIIRLHEFGLLKVIHPSIALDKDLIALLTAVKKVLSWYDLLFLEESYMKWAVYFLALIRGCDAEHTEEICRRFELAPKRRKLFQAERSAAERCLVRLERCPDLKNDQLYRNLSGFPTELILYLMAATGRKHVKKAISLYITSLRYVSIEIGGADLKAMGLKPGPIYRQVLQSVKDAKLNGRLKNKNEELRYARQYIQKITQTGNGIKQPDPPSDPGLKS